MRNFNCVLLSMLFLFVPMAALAGDLDSPAAPTSAESAMYTLEDIYNRLDDNTQGTKRPGAFTEPSAAPGSTGYTLDQVYEKAIPTQVGKTGQTAFYATGDDGDLEKGVAWPNTRFTDNSDGTVTDNLTGLIWLKVANYKTSSTTGSTTWALALSFCNSLHNGQCGLTDGSLAGDWRLPNVKELHSLVDFGQYSPALPSGHPFTDVQTNSYYWSSTTTENSTTKAWNLYPVDGSVPTAIKTSGSFVWPVRDRQ